MQVEPYLRSYKRRRAQLILDQYLALTPRNGKYSVKTMGLRGAFDRRRLAIVP